MSQSYYRAFYHFVWTTWNREPLLVHDVEEYAYRLIQRECTDMKVNIFALGGVADHIHLLVTLPSTLSIADFMEAVKGTSSYAINKKYSSSISGFKWQSGYGIHTVSPSHVKKVVRYIENQKQHHMDGSLWDCEPPDRFASGPQG